MPSSAGDEPDAGRSRVKRIAGQMVVVVATAIAFVALWHAGWVGDAFALAMPVVLVASAATTVSVLLVRPSWCAAPIVLVVSSALVIFGPRLPQRTAAPQEAVHLAAVNLQFDSTEVDGNLASVSATGANVLVVSELTAAADVMLRQMFPYAVVSHDLLRVESGQGVYSTFALTDLGAPRSISPTTDQLLRVRVDGPAPFVLYGVHLPRPTFASPAPRGEIAFAGHRATVLDLDRAVDADALDGPVVIAGDLNLSDRTTSFRRLASGRLDVARTGWATSTYVGSLLWELSLLRIDHLLAPGDWCASDAGSFELPGSDHLGVHAVIGPCPP